MGHKTEGQAEMELGTNGVPESSDSVGAQKGKHSLQGEVKCDAIAQGYRPMFKTGKLS